MAFKYTIENQTGVVLHQGTCDTKDIFLACTETAITVARMEKAGLLTKRNKATRILIEKV